MLIPLQKMKYGSLVELLIIYLFLYDNFVCCCCFFFLQIHFVKFSKTWLLFQVWFWGSVFYDNHACK